MALGSRIIGILITTFICAVIYGLLLTTYDFMNPGYNPVASGHRAATNIYGLFGTVNHEIERNDANDVHGTSIAQKIAMPYAVTADLSAIFGGKIEMGLSALFHHADRNA